MKSELKNLQLTEEQLAVLEKSLDYQYGTLEHNIIREGRESFVSKNIIRPQMSVIRDIESKIYELKESEIK